MLLAFAMFVTSKVLLQLLVAVSPVFVGAGAFQPSRFLLRGFAGGIAGVITAQILVVALLGIAFNVENQLLAPVLASAANANVTGLIASLLIPAVCSVPARCWPSRYRRSPSASPGACSMASRRGSRPEA